MSVEPAESFIAKLNAELLKKELQLQELKVRNAMLRHHGRNDIRALSMLFAAQSRRALQPELCKSCMHHLHQADGLNHLAVCEEDEPIVMAEYLTALSRAIMTPFDSRIRMSLVIDKEIALDFVRAQRVGLIFSEALANALKHAFPGLSGGSINSLLRRDGDRVALSVIDDGAGFDPPPKAEPGSGLSFMEALAESLSGELVIRSSRAGTAISLTCPGK